jgi:hypothetical protein
MTHLPLRLTAFNFSIDLVWEGIPIEETNQATHRCEAKQFYLAIPKVARFLALPEQNCIVIERANASVSFQLISTWLLGTVMAYVLQYHNYLVLHGSAMLVQGRAVIFSGPSGAGKSTLANAFLQKGYPFITDDLVVIKREKTGQYCILKGPAKIKLWEDAMQHFDYDVNNATPTHYALRKYAMPVEAEHEKNTFSIGAFYELSALPGLTHTRQKLSGTEALKVLMQNAYRYFMLESLDKLPIFFKDCSVLSQQIAVNQLTRTTNFFTLDGMIQRIEQDRGIT